MLYQVWLRSVPGMYEQYVTKVQVNADTPGEAIAKAKRKTKDMGFPDRSPAMWKCDSVEEIHVID